MTIKGTIQFSSDEFAKLFKQGLIGPKIDKKNSYDIFDVLKKKFTKGKKKNTKEVPPTTGGGRKRTRRRRKRTRRRKRSRRRRKRSRRRKRKKY
jgi:hypothetical protein